MTDNILKRKQNLITIILVLMSILLLLTPLLDLIILWRNGSSNVIRLSGYERLRLFIEHGGFYGVNDVDMSRFYSFNISKFYDSVVVVTLIIVIAAMIGPIMIIFLKNKKFQKVCLIFPIIQLMFTFFYLVLGIVYVVLEKKECFKEWECFSVCFIPFLIGCLIIFIYFKKMRSLQNTKTTKIE